MGKVFSNWTSFLGNPITSWRGFHPELWEEMHLSIGLPETNSVQLGLWQIVWRKIGVNPCEYILDENIAPSCSRVRHVSTPGKLTSVRKLPRHFSGVMRSAISSVICTSCSAQSCTAFSNCLDMDNKWTAWEGQPRVVREIHLQNLTKKLLKNDGWKTAFFPFEILGPGEFSGANCFQLRGCMTPTQTSCNIIYHKEIHPSQMVNKISSLIGVIMLPTQTSCNIIRDIFQIYHRLTSTLIPPEGWLFEFEKDDLLGGNPFPQKMFVAKHRIGGVGFKLQDLFKIQPKKQPGLRIIPRRFHVSLNGNFRT